MVKLRFFSAFLISLLLVGLWGNLSGQTLLFQSGFEPHTTLQSPVSQGGEWYQVIDGVDTTTGYEWPNDFPTRDSLDAFWTFKVPDTVPLTDYASVKLDTVLDRNNDSTRALFMKVTDYSSTNFDNSMPGHVRCEYRLNVDTVMKQYYLKYWMKVQSNMYSSIMPFGSGRWRIFMEWFETGSSYSDYRWSLSMRCGTFASDSTSAHFRLANEYQLSPSGPFSPDTVLNTQAVVPTGEWFKFETYWRQAPDSTGRIWIAMNGNTIFDFRGRNMHDTTPSPISNWQIFKLYTDEPSMDDGDVYQWIDDVEVWDTIPETATFKKQTKANERLSVNLFPNPSSGSFMIQLDGAGKGPYSYHLINVNGAILDHQTFHQTRHRLSVAPLSPGVYLYRVKDLSTGYRRSGKIVVH